MKQLHRKTLILGAGVAAVVAATSLVLYFTVWQQPGKQDYSQASAKAKEISGYQGSKLLDEFVTKVNQQSKAGLTQPKLAESVSAEKKKIDDAIDTRARLAEEMKTSIVLRDEQVKRAYDTYVAQEKKYDTYMKGYAATYPSYKSSFDTCIKVFQINDQAGNDLTKYAPLHREASKACFVDLDAVIRSPVTPLANYAKEFKRIINERQKTFDGLEKKTLNTDQAGARIKELGNEYTKNSPVKALQEYVKDARFDGELNDLIKLLDDKAKAAE